MFKATHTGTVWFDGLTFSELPPPTGQDIPPDMATLGFETYGAINVNLLPQGMAGWSTVGNGFSLDSSTFTELLWNISCCSVFV